MDSSLGNELFRERPYMEPNQGFFIAQRQPDGSPGRPIGNDDGAIMMFEELDKVLEVRKEMEAEHGPLGVYKVNMVFAGEVIA